MTKGQVMQMNVKEFMAELYKGAPSKQVTYLFTLPDRATYPYQIGQMDQMLEKAMALNCSKDVYFGLHLMDEPPLQGARASASDISGISFIHGEYDIKGPAHKEENLPKTQEELLNFPHGLECPPSIIVHSGNGLHTYWLLQEYTAVNDENREAIKRIVKGHELHTQKLGRAYGWKFDSVADLARVLRIPGTLNHKSDPPRQVEIIEANLARFSLAAFAKYADEAAEYTGERIHFTPDPDRVGPVQRIIDGCAFVRYCRDEAANLPEPFWYAMITNVAPASDGAEAVHVLSEAYPDYSKGETDAKIRHALAQNKPHTCWYIRESLGFECPAGGCGVKAPVVLAQYTLEERVQQLLERELTAEEVFEENTLSLMAYARERMPGVYGKFKLRLRRMGVSLRDFERAVAHQAEMEKLQSAEFNVIGGRPISIAELDLHGAVEPEGFSVSLKDGIQKTALAFGETVMLSEASEPVVITRKLENVDDGQEKLEITFRRNGKLKSIRIPRSVALNKTQLIRYADSGLPVNSGNAEDMVSYLAAYRHRW